MNVFRLAIKCAAIFSFMAAGPVFSQELRSLNAAGEDCGNNPDNAARIIACSEMIAHPQATPEDLAGAYWGRAYVRCVDGTGSAMDVIADLMANVRVDPEGWKHMYNVAYDGPSDGRYPIAYKAVRGYVDATCSY